MCLDDNPVKVTPISETEDKGYRIGRNPEEFIKQTMVDGKIIEEIVPESSVVIEGPGISSETPSIGVDFEWLEGLEKKCFESHDELNKLSLTISSVISLMTAPRVSVLIMDVLKAELKDLEKRKKIVLLDIFKFMHPDIQTTTENL